MYLSKKVTVCNQEINESEVIVHACTFENKKEDFIPYSPPRISVNCNVEKSTENNDVGSSDNTRKFTPKTTHHKSDKNRCLDTFDDTDDTEKIEDDGIRHLAPRVKYDTKKYTISGLTTSSYREHTRHSDGPFFVFADGKVSVQTIEQDRYNRLYESIDGKTSHECDSSLASRILSNILPLLEPTLTKALSSGNHTIATSISSYITDKSSAIVERFRCKYQDILKETNVWMGTECLCNKADEINYEGKTCNVLKPLLIVEANSDLKCLNAETFHGFQIKVLTNNSFRREESRAIAKGQLPDPQQRLDKVPKSMAKLLFKRHSNLTMVCPAAFKSIGFETKEHKVLKINCISLFCRVKGIIPIGEHHFPLKIKGNQTDVLEGTSYFASAVHIGDKIYNDKGEIGTLGGFVKYYGIDTFLTCAHVIFGKSNISNLQTKDIHFNCHTIRNDNTNEPVKCTLIRHILKYDTEETNMDEDDMESPESEEETSIDAALVFIQIPNTSHDPIGNCCAIPNSTASCANQSVELRIKLKGYGDKTDLSTLGLRSIYLNENFIDTAVQHSRAIALSAITGRQERLISLSKSDKLSVLVPSHVRINTNIMYNQFVVQNMDFQEGDSGTCIYSPFTGVTI
ncbi:unnamed protein product [Mytilus coruscus]|uniref:Uncharacterized protein n=1 Tax=Mytilus coruscus TaxID=42192 RepID=A0A6J8B9H4_MYTCO|nr:unnamed protein product [Mytilus coruscus]